MVKKLLFIAALSISFAYAAPCCKAADANNTKACDINTKSSMACGMKGKKSCGPVCMHKGPIHCFKIAKLGLNKDQKAKIAEISKKYTTEIAAAQKCCEVMPMHFVKDGKFDKDGFIAKHNEVATNMAALKAKMFEEAYSVLNEQQKAKFAEFAAK